jgi:hypothetical protein
MLAVFYTHLYRHSLEALISCPELAFVYLARGKKVHVNEADATPHEGMAFNKEEDLVIIGFGDDGQCVQQRYDFLTVTEIATGELAQDERMEDGIFSFQQRAEAPARFTKVVNPNRCVDKDHYAVLRRGIRCASGSEPPRAARRCALWRAIRASSPIRTKVVFSHTPVSREAFCRIASSILSVVFIWASMALSYACVNSQRGPDVSLKAGSPKGKPLGTDLLSGWAMPPMGADQLPR